MKPTYLLFATVALLASCKEKPASNATTSTKPAAEASAALQAVLAAAPKGEPQSIVNAKTTAKPGEEITITGRIMGSSSPFVDGRAAFILGDPAVLTACSDTPGDECETPWDNCCDSKEDKKRGTVTVQIIDADGRVLKEPVEDVGGIKKLATLTVTGKVAEGSTADLLILNATAIQAAK
jgi:hypothetical protein